MNQDPHLAWKSIKTITKNFKAHHIPAKVMRMRRQNGELATTDKENMEVMMPHFTKVFNNDKPVDWTLLNEIKQKATMFDLNDPTTYLEFSRCLFRMKNNKAPGISGVTVEAIKALEAPIRSRIHRLIVEFWEGKKDHEEWHINLLACLPKSGDLADPNKWRGICLIDMTSKICSCLINERLHKVLKKHGLETQSGSTPERGCADATFTLKSALHLRKAHNLPSWAAFIDLVKAYDTINHSLLWEILYKFGIPKNLIGVIKRMYKGTEVVLKIGDLLEHIKYGVGVKQGDPMAPVLFIFAIQSAI